MSAFAIQAGLCVNELTGLTIADSCTGTGAHVHCAGKDRKWSDLEKIDSALCRDLIDAGVAWFAFFDCQVVERGVPTRPVVVYLDPFESGRDEGLEIGPGTGVDQFLLVGCIE